MYDNICPMLCIIVNIVCKSHLVMLEKQLCDSCLDEKCFEENAVLTNLKMIQTTSSDTPSGSVLVKLTLVLL